MIEPKECIGKLSKKFLDACRSGNLEMVKYLLTSNNLENKPNINYTNEYDKSALILACRYGNIRVVEYLLTSLELKEHSNLYYKNKNDWNALMYAFDCQNFEIIKYLLIDMNMKVDENTINWIQNNYNDKENYETFLKIIGSKNLYNKLNEKIDNNEIIIKRVKL